VPAAFAVSENRLRRAPPLVALAFAGLAAAAAGVAPGRAQTLYQVTSAPYGAKCDGRTNDTRAIQAAERAAASAGGGTVVLPAGRCVISTGIAWDSGVNVRGAGMHATTLVADARFGFEPNDPRVRRGQNGKLMGLIWLDGPTQTAPLRNVRISDLGFDPRAGTQSYAVSGKGTYHCITANMRPLQNVTFENLFFELGTNETYPTAPYNGPKGFFGIELPVLGVDPANPSYGLTFRNIEAHNGYGTIQMALGGTTNKSGETSEAHDITIDGVHDTIDENNIADDRTVIDGVSRPASGKMGQIFNVTVRDLTTTVSDAVTVGSVNAFKINPEKHTIVHDVTVDGITYRGSANGAFGAPLPTVNSKNGSGSPLAIDADPEDGFVRNVTVRNISAVNSMGIIVELGAERGASVDTTLSTITLTNCYAPGGAFVVSTVAPASGTFTVSNFKVSASPVALAHGQPAGLYLSARAGASFTGTMTIEGGTISGYGRPVYVGRGFDGLVLHGVTWDRGRPQLSSAVRVQ
jgi:hypothetical protein